MSGAPDEPAHAGDPRPSQIRKPLHFPEFESVPETKVHFELRTLLYQVLKLAFADRAAIGCDQFVYWDPTEPRSCLAPDGFVRLGEPDHLFRTWKVWQHGAPHVAVEIISDFDARPVQWSGKLEKYRRLGVMELVGFDAAASDRPLRVWDSVDGELVEREGAALHAQSRCLPGFWVAIEQPGIGLALRLSHDEQGSDLYPTPAEALQAEAEAKQAEAEAKQAEAEAKQAEAERRIRELEEALRRKSP